MAKVRLARDQVITVDGVILQGTRDFELTQDLDGVDVTPWTASGTAQITLCESATLKLQIYHLEDVQRIGATWNKFPPQPLEISITRVGAGRFIVSNLTSSGQFGQVLSYTVTLKSWPYA